MKLLAHALNPTHFTSGSWAKAETRFREAEQAQKQMQPDYPLPCSQQGFIYCDPLLAVPERPAWQRTLRGRRFNGRAKRWRRMNSNAEAA